MELRVQPKEQKGVSQQTKQVQGKIKHKQQIQEQVCWSETEAIREMGSRNQGHNKEDKDVAWNL